MQKILTRSAVKPKTTRKTAVSDLMGTASGTADMMIMTITARLRSVRSNQWQEEKCSDEK